MGRVWVRDQFTGICYSAFHQVGPGYRTQILGFGSKPLHLLSPLSGPLGLPLDPIGHLGSLPGSCHILNPTTFLCCELVPSKSSRRTWVCAHVGFPSPHSAFYFTYTCLTELQELSSLSSHICLGRDYDKHDVLGVFETELSRVALPVLVLAV